jgi:hypothetical protein
MIGQEKRFKNTFAPNVLADELSVSAIIRMLFLSAIHTDDLPPEVLKAVSDEMLKRTADEGESQ